MFVNDHDESMSDEISRASNHSLSGWRRKIVRCIPFRDESFDPDLGRIVARHTYHRNTLEAIILYPAR